MAYGNADFNALLSTTMDNYRATLEDNLSKNVVLWHFLKKNGRITKRGGAKIIEPVLTTGIVNSGSYSLYDEVSIATTGEEGITAAEFDWRQHAATVAIAGIEEAKNSGKEAVIDLLQGKIEQAEITATNDFDVMFNGDGTNNSNKDFLGLAALIGDENGIATVGGIDCTDALNAWWRSYVDNTATPITITDMNRAYHEAVRGTNKPNFGVTTLELYLAYMGQLVVNQRYEDVETAQAGFTNVTFQSHPLVWGENVPSGTCTFVNTKFLRLNTLGDTWLKNTPFSSPEDKDAKWSKILSYGNLSVSNRKLAGSRLEGRTA